MPLDFTFDEVRRVMRVCSAIRIGRSSRPYLQRFLEIRLRPRDPALAARVRALDPSQMDELCRKVRSLQRAQDQRAGA
jgi:hypothetical protein